MIMIARKQMGRAATRVGSSYSASLPRPLPALPLTMCKLTSTLRSFSGSSGLSWQQQAEAEARGVSKGRSSVAAGESPSTYLMDKLNHEMQGERVMHANTLDDRLRNLIAKCHANTGNRDVYAALRKRAISTRQELIVQREASGMALDQQMNATNIEALFPIPPMQ